MNETINNLLNRRSIRSYKTEQITDDALNAILEAGIYAATSRGREAWFLTAVQNPALLKKIRDAACDTLRKAGDEKSLAKANDPAFSPFYNAPSLIIVSGNDTPNTRIDCANACQNMCVAAQSLGLGSCYLAGYTQAFQDPAVAAELKKALEIPEGFHPQFGVCVGYTDEKPAKPERDRTKVKVIK